MSNDPRPGVRAVIEDLTSLDDIIAVAVMRRDGLMIDHELPEDADPKKIAAMSAAIFGTGEIAAEVMNHGRFLRSVVESDEGKILSTGAGPEAILVALVNSQCNMGLVLMVVEKASDGLQAALSGKGVLKAEVA